MDVVVRASVVDVLVVLATEKRVRVPRGGRGSGRGRQVAVVPDPPELPPQLIDVAVRASVVDVLVVPPATEKRVRVPRGGRGSGRGRQVAVVPDPPELPPQLIDVAVRASV